MTHDDLVISAYRWTLKRCGVAFREFNTGASNGEYPDVIGFRSGGESVLVECKASRSDFLSDKKKFFRANPQFGMGRFRFYCCPDGLIKAEELPEKWGLIYVNEAGKARLVFNPYNQKSLVGNYWLNGWEQNMKAEHELMYSALRRLHLSGRIEEVYIPLSARTGSVDSANSKQ